jgi:hypothetical protein
MKKINAQNDMGVISNQVKKNIWSKKGLIIWGSTTTKEKKKGPVLLEE